MKKKILLKLAFPVLLAGISLNAVPQQLNYPEIFGDNWQKALSFLKENDSWIKPVLDKNNIPYAVAIGIIFPELVRYSALRDKMEVALLKTLYINMGEDYADFSIGPFQMKPSFAEAIRKRAPDVMGRKSKKLFREDPGQDDLKKYRKMIVLDLENAAMQLNYLVAFIRICESDYKGKWQDENSKLRFLATAYNSGIGLSAEKITGMMNMKFFNTSLFKSESYSYQEISACWYSNNASK